MKNSSNSGGTLTADQRRRILRRIEAAQRQSDNVKNKKEASKTVNSVPKISELSSDSVVTTAPVAKKTVKLSKVSSSTHQSFRKPKKTSPDPAKRNIKGVVNILKSVKKQPPRPPLPKKTPVSAQAATSNSRSESPRPTSRPTTTRGGAKKRTSVPRGGMRGAARPPREIVSIPESQKKPNMPVPAIAKDTLRIIPIGGNEEVGRNMNIFEYGNDIVIIDMGMQFPEADMPGIDYIVPNADYLKGKEKNIRAVIFTHGHLDHIGAAPILLKELGYPPVVARDLTLALIKKKMGDYDPAGIDKLKAITVKDINVPVRLGNFVARFFEVEHSIMDSMGVALETPVGTPIHMGDWTINHDPVDGNVITYENLKSLPSPKILMVESLGSTKTGAAPSEKVIQGSLESLIDAVPGRLFIATFASQIKRIGLILQHAQRVGKKVALDGYSMRTNVEIAQELGYLKVRKDLMIPISEADKYPDNKILVLCTGAQGDNNAALNRIVTDNHRFITLKRSDTIVFSSSVIPGNERAVQTLKDNLYRKCDNVIHSEIMDVHMGGHSTASDIKDLVKMVEPDFFFPVYANHYMLKEAGKRAVETGFDKDKILVLDNGQIAEFGHTSKPTIRKERADASYVFVDGLGVGDIGHVVLRDRKMLSEDGMYVITIMVDSKSKQIIGNIQITSRGFIYVKDNFDILNETKKIVKKAIGATTSKGTRMDWRITEGAIRDRVGEYLFQQTERRPMVLPVIVEV